MGAYVPFHLTVEGISPSQTARIYLKISTFWSKVKDLEFHEIVLNKLWNFLFRAKRIDLI